VGGVTAEREFTASRKNGSGRPRGYASWRPQAKTTALLTQIEEVLEEYADHLPLTVRQVFYRLVARYGYDKTERSYERLGEVLVRARRAKLIPFDYIRDDGVVTVREQWFAGQEQFWNAVGATIKRYRRDRQQGQRYRLELWAEAAGMLPQLARIADDYSVPVYSSGGFSSLTAVRTIVDRAIERDQPTVILHVGDYDPSGVSIFESAMADVAAFVEEDRIIMSQSVTASRVALTEDQVYIYDLPTAPAKTSDSRSAAWKGETCQLEALAPDLLAVTVREAIEQWFDADKLRAVVGLEAGERVDLLRALPAGRA
jgi:hypothetical protein